jgi:subfamily B ATP-binding cassette protein MsbA
MSNEHSKFVSGTTFALLKRLTGVYIRPYSGRIACAVFFMMVAAAATGFLAKLMQPIIDRIFLPGQQSQAALVQIGLIVLGVFLVRGISTYVYTLILSRLSQRVVANVQTDMFRHLLYADTGFFQQHQSGSLIARFVSDTYLIRSALVEGMTGMGKNAFTVIVLVGLMFYQNWQLSIICLFAFPAATFMISKVGKKLRKASHLTQEETGALTAILGQSFQGNRHIKAYVTEEFELGRVKAIIENVYRTMDKIFRTSAAALPLAEMLAGVAVLSIILYGGSQVIAGKTTPGALFSFMTAFLLAFEPMKRLAKLNGGMQMGLAAADRFFTLLDTKPAIAQKPDATAISVQKGHIVFDDVTFAYPNGTLALDRVSFEVPAGKSVALVGASGAGKSTILNLIPRFYDVTSGRVLIDGRDIRDVTLSSLRHSMALVSQDVAIFNDSIRDNIRYGTPDASEEAIINAAKMAVAHDFIMEMPMGYDTKVGENGVKLSGGQRQRISIARAMLKNAPVLLLDEATSALDTTSERQVQTALERLQSGRTTIIVAHRLSTIMGADIIYVLDQGRIIESGTHETLLQKGGAYSKLYGALSQEAA